MQPEQQQRIMGYFIEEAKEHLDTIEQGLLNLQRTIEDAETINEVFRAAHSIKGGAAMLGLNSIQRVAHRLEDYFKLLRERPIRVDQKLETLFLQVSDALETLLVQLQGPFGLSEEAANGVLAGVEPTFTELENHLGTLTAGGNILPRPMEVPSPFSEPLPTAAGADSALLLMFGSDVPARLREMLQLFKQAESEASRQQLHSICQSLISLGEQYDLVSWCQLLETAQRAIAHSDNTYRALAPIVIKDIKQAQELVLAGRLSEIVACAQLQEMAPAAAPVAEEPSLADFLSLDAIDDFSVETAFSAMGDEDPFAAVPEPIVPAENAPALDGGMLFGASDDLLLDNDLFDQNGPEVGMEELNSLADLFEGEVPDLGSGWQEEEIVGDATSALNLETSPAPQDLAADSDFSDLLFDASETPDRFSNDDFGDLFEDAPVEEAGAAERTAPPVEEPVASNLGSVDDDLSDFLAIPSTGGAAAAGNPFDLTEDVFSGLNLDEDDAFASRDTEGTVSDPLQPETALDNLGELFAGMNEADLPFQASAEGTLDLDVNASAPVSPPETAISTNADSVVADPWGDLEDLNLNLDSPDTGFGDADLSLADGSDLDSVFADENTGLETLEDSMDDVALDFGDLLEPSPAPQAMSDELLEELTDEPLDLSAFSSLEESEATDLPLTDDLANFDLSVTGSPEPLSAPAIGSVPVGSVPDPWEDSLSSALDNPIPTPNPAETPTPPAEPDFSLEDLNLSDEASDLNDFNLDLDSPVQMGFPSEESPSEVDLGLLDDERPIEDLSLDLGEELSLDLDEFGRSESASSGAEVEGMLDVDLDSLDLTESVPSAAADDFGLALDEDLLATADANPFDELAASGSGEEPDSDRAFDLGDLGGDFDLESSGLEDFSLDSSEISEAMDFSETFSNPDQNGASAAIADSGNGEEFGELNLGDADPIGLEEMLADEPLLNLDDDGLNLTEEADLGFDDSLVGASSSDAASTLPAEEIPDLNADLFDTDPLSESGGDLNDDLLALDGLDDFELDGPAQASPESAIHSDADPFGFDTPTDAVPELSDDLLGLGTLDAGAAPELSDDLLGLGSTEAEPLTLAADAIAADDEDLLGFGDLGMNFPADDAASDDSDLFGLDDLEVENSAAAEGTGSDDLFGFDTIAAAVPGDAATIELGDDLLSFTDSGAEASTDSELDDLLEMGSPGIDFSAEDSEASRLEESTDLDFDSLDELAGISGATDELLGDLSFDAPEGAIDPGSAELHPESSQTGNELGDLDDIFAEGLASPEEAFGLLDGSEVSGLEDAASSDGELGELNDLLSEPDPDSSDQFDDLDAFLGGAEPTFGAADDPLADLDQLLEEPEAASSSSDGEFAELDQLMADDTTEAVGDFASLDNLLVDTPDDGDFVDLDSLLADSASGLAVSAAATTPLGRDAAQDDFADLEALLGEDSPATAEVRPAETEFDELDDLLKDAEEKLGGPPSVKTNRGAAQRPGARVSRVGTEQTMRVPVKHLDNLSNLVGELVVNRNSLEQDQERLRQSLDNLLYQVQQLSDVGQRMQDLYERSLLESSLLASRQNHRMTSPLHSGGDGAVSTQSTNSTGVEYDPLEMDRFTGFHSLSQEMIELIVRVRESASDIEFIVDETDQVTRMFRQVTTQLQEGLTRSRMMPFAQTADRLPRAVRDISIKVGKQAELHIEGRDTLIDKMILEKLYDPLTHLVNNAITHGIELPNVRRAAGKSQSGRIVIRAFHQGNQTIISVSDDGAGIDVDRVRQKAIEKGLVTRSEAQTLSRLDIYDLLFHPGFSTADQVDEFRGRGVGMDVVRTSLSEIRGVINTDSTSGKGTTFTIRLPLTLSISKALCCISDRARIAFPMDGVEDMLDLPKERIQLNAEGQQCISWRDSLLPLRPLNELLSYSRHLSRGTVYGGNQEDDIISIVVLRSAGNFLALQVDQVLGEQEIVIKQLEGPVPKPVGVAGATVLGDGRIMPIADVLELIDLSMGRIRRDVGGPLWEQDGATVIQDVAPVKTEPMVLIVDDSITVRELLSMTFNKVGYRVEQARDGQEAWEKLRAGLPCDIVFCDIEMPRMDGLELLSRIQKDPALNRLPIAMLTSRGADRHRQMASSLGASGYFTKPYLEEALLDAAQRMLKGERLL